MDIFEYNFRAGIHNLNMVGKAEKIVNEFLDDDSKDFIYVCNPDGSYLKLQKGVKFVAGTGLGIEIIK